MNNVSVDIDRKLVADVQKRLGEFHKKAPNAIAKALNRAMTNVNSNIKKEIRKEYHIKSRDIASTLSKPARATKNNLYAEVNSKGRPIGIDKFKVSPKTVNPNRKSPIKIAVKKDGVKKAMGAFIADINGIKAFKRTSGSRLPIQRLFGPSVPQMLEDEGIQEEVNQLGQETFDKRLDHEIERILEKGRA
ncbi:phage tail protein [Gracilibacillus sp. YIM 98692]|uniref:phage tail protein n=1 Tax=Gracilibacillus sp. YIM 98692 TaxID=2663532 RepID=UPI0013D81FC4|nr:phage tail protein [Gracilibacillus sp. YIM 98692]